MQTLRDWQPFYGLTGEVAGTLMGLMFIALSLGSNRTSDHDESPERRSYLTSKVRAFVSPTIIHLTSVLVMSAVMCMPIHRVISLSVCLGFVGLSGVVYLLNTLQALRDHHRQRALESDHWMFHFHLPFLCYIAAIGTAAALPFTLEALPFLAGGTILFLVVGVRNSWLSTLYTSGVKR